MSAAAGALFREPRERSPADHDELCEWVLGICPTSIGGGLTHDQQRQLFAQLRGQALAPHEQLQGANEADHRNYIVLRGELRAFGNGSHVGTISPGGSIGQIDEEEYHHTDSLHAGPQGCVLGVLDYAHSLAAHGRTMPASTKILREKEPSHRTTQDVRVLLALLEDLPFFKQLPSELDRLVSCRHLRLEELEEGSVICQEGSIGEKFYIVLQGNVEVRVEAEVNGLEELGVGGSFGKLSLLGATEEERTLHTTIVAGSQCVCATLHRDAFRQGQQDAQAQLAAVLAKPSLRRTRSDATIVEDALLYAAGVGGRAAFNPAEGAGQPSPNRVLPQMAKHATLVNMRLGETLTLPGGSFVLPLEGQAVVDEGASSVFLQSGGPEFSTWWEKQADDQAPSLGYGVEALLQQEAGLRGWQAGGGKEQQTTTVPLRAKTDCVLAVLCGSDIRHIRRRAALQGSIDKCWALCGGSDRDDITQLGWTDLWQSILKLLSPAEEFSADAALAWCVSDWDRMIKFTWGPQADDISLSHNAFSEALTTQIEEWWDIAEPCPVLHGAWLKEVLGSVVGKDQTLKELSAVRNRSEFFLKLRGDARQLMLMRSPPGQRSALERVEAELSAGSFSLAEAFELETSAPMPFFDEEEDRSRSFENVAAAGSFSSMPADVTQTLSHWGQSYAAGGPSQWSQRLHQWSAGPMTPAHYSTEEGPEVGEAGVGPQDDEQLNATVGSVEWGKVERDSDEESDAPPVNPQHPPPSKMRPVELHGGPPPRNEKNVRMASPPREREPLDENGRPSPPPNVKMEQKKESSWLGPKVKLPVPPPMPSPVKRRTHKDIAKEVFAQRHTGAIKDVAIPNTTLRREEVIEPTDDELRRLPIVGGDLTRSGNTQSWAPKHRLLPQEINIGKPRGTPRPFQAPPDPSSKDPDTGLQKNRHNSRTTKPQAGPGNAEQRATARAERQKLAKEKAEKTRNVVPGAMAPAESPREVLKPFIVGTPTPPQGAVGAQSPRQVLTAMSHSTVAEMKDGGAKPAEKIRSMEKILTAEPEKVIFVSGVDTHPDRTYAVLPSGVPKEWIALHYKAEKKRKKINRQADQKCAEAIARGVRVPSAVIPVKAAAKKKMPFVAAIGFAKMGAALEGGGPVFTANQTITGAKWQLREENSLCAGRPAEIVPSATPYGHSGPRKPLERLAAPATLKPWAPTADLVRTPRMITGGTDHKWHSPSSLAATLTSPRLASMSSRARLDQGSKEFWFRKSLGAAPEAAETWTVSSTDLGAISRTERGSAEYSQMWMNTTILDRK